MRSAAARGDATGTPVRGESCTWGRMERGFGAGNAPAFRGEEGTIDTSSKSPRVGLFVTCLVDLFRPNVGFAAISLLEAAGCRVEVPPRQTCCGQPAYNSGDEVDSQAIARQVITAFEGFDYVVVPSGSCAGTFREHYPSLFPTDIEWQNRAIDFALRCRELFSFLHDDLGFREIDAQYPGVVTYHASCSGLRELQVREQPRALLSLVRGLRLSEMQDTDVCCGFGGTFCVKFPEISERMVSDKVDNIAASGADTVLGGDLGCLLNIAGRLARTARPVRVYHAAEVIAGMTGVPAIGEAGGGPASPETDSR